MDNENYGRDATCPAGNGTVPTGSILSGAGVLPGITGTRHGRVEAIRQVLYRPLPVHAGGIFPADMKPGLSDRLVKKIDRFARKITRGGYRRSCL